MRWKKARSPLADSLPNMSKIFLGGIPKKPCENPRTNPSQRASPWLSLYSKVHNRIVRSRMQWSRMGLIPSTCRHSKVRVLKLPVMCYWSALYALSTITEYYPRNRHTFWFSVVASTFIIGLQWNKNRRRIDRKLFGLPVLLKSMMQRNCAKCYRIPPNQAAIVSRSTQ